MTEQEKEELFELYRDDFVREILLKVIDGEIENFEEIDTLIREYSVENGVDYEDMDIVLEKGMEQLHFFER